MAVSSDGRRTVASPTDLERARPDGERTDRLQRDVEVVVVAADADRLGEYQDALRRAQVPTRATVDADEAEAFLSGLSPDVLVLDRGLPRLILFRLYGLVREDPNEPPVQVVFVGQEGETGPGDDYLPGDPSPSNVAERVTELLASASTAPATVLRMSPPPRPRRPRVGPSDHATYSGRCSGHGRRDSGSGRGSQRAGLGGDAHHRDRRRGSPAVPATNGVNGEAAATEVSADDEAPTDLRSAPAAAWTSL